MPVTAGPRTTAGTRLCGVSARWPSFPRWRGARGSLLAEQLAEPGWQRGVGDVGALPDEHDIL